MMKAFQFLVLYQLFSQALPFEDVQPKRNSKLQFFQNRVNLMNDEEIVVPNELEKSNETSSERFTRFDYSGTKYEKCRAQTEDLSSYELNSYNEPYWFYYLGHEMGNDGKDWTSYLNCVNTENNFACNYEDIGRAIHANCEEKNGVLYKVNLDISCKNGYQSHDRNLPICVGKSCSMDDKFFKRAEDFQLCPFGTLVEFEKEVAKERPILRQECKAQMSKFTEDAGYGDPNFVFNKSFDFEKYCTSTTNEDGLIVESCDFSPLVETLKAPCTAQGGVLYKFSDKITYSKGYNGGQPLETTFLNTPLCMGTSCFVKKYFERLLIPSNRFYFDGDYNRDTTYWYTSNYTMLGYTPVLQRENPCSEFVLEVSEIDGVQVEQTKSCKWLAKRPIETRKRICTKRRYQINSKEMGLGSAPNVCVETCAPFCRLEKISAKFLYERDENSVVLTKDCKWLQNQEPEVISEVCSSHVVLDAEDSIYGQAAETCTATCKTC